MTSLLVAALLALLGLARAEPPSATTILFEQGGAPGVSMPVVLPKGAPVKPPDDLVAAASRWSHEAQIARLGRDQSEPKESFSIVVIGDAEPGRFAWERIYSPGKDVFRKLLSRAQDLKPDFVLQLGDFVSLGTPENYRKLVKLLDAEARVPLFSAIGNHDRSRPNGDANKLLYKTLFGTTDFYFDYNGWRFVGLDTADRRLADRQVEWLGQVLETELRKIVFTHVPPAFLKGKLKSCPEPAAVQQDGEAPQAEGYWKDVMTGYFSEGSSAFKELMEKRSVERVYMGHVHAYGAADIGATRYILSGGGGSPLYPLPPGEPKCKMAHFIEVRLGPGPVEEIVHALGGGR